MVASRPPCSLPTALRAASASSRGIGAAGLPTSPPSIASSDGSVPVVDVSRPPATSMNPFSPEAQSVVRSASGASSGSGGSGRPAGSPAPPPPPPRVVSGRMTAPTLAALAGGVETTASLRAGSSGSADSGGIAHSTSVTEHKGGGGSGGGGWAGGVGGGGDGGGGWGSGDGASAQAAAAAREIAELKAAMAQLIDVVVQQKAHIEQLQAQNAALRARLPPGPSHSGSPAGSPVTSSFRR
jgi:hypothetical protein